MKINSKIRTKINIGLCALGIMFFAINNNGENKVVGSALAAKPEKIDICHATDSHTNPYDNGKKEVSYDSIVTVPNGHDTHNGPVWYAGIADHSWGDIIPSFSWTECPEDESLYTSDDSSKACQINLGRDGKKYADEIILNYAGKNWPEGEAVFNNNCEIPGDTCEETTTCPTQCDYEGGEIQGECGPITCDATQACEPTPTPTATPSASPTPSITPSVTPTGTPTPENPDKESSKLWVEKLACDQYDFRAEMDLMVDNNPVKDVLVSFTYNGLSKNAYTNQDGRASTSFTYTGEAVVKATPNNGFASQESKVTIETNCQELGGIVSTPASTYTQVLGADTYAETGVFEDVMMSIVGLGGATMTSIGARLHAKKKN